MYLAEIMPFVRAAGRVDIGFPRDPVGEGAACLARFIRAFHNNDCVRPVISYADEFFARSCFDRVCKWRLVPKELLREVDDLPELTVATGSKGTGDFLRDVLWRINVV